MSPVWFYGPSWSYFHSLPHNGFGMGCCLLGVGLSQLLALYKDSSARVLSFLFFLSAFVFWTAGLILGAEGVLGHQGLMEAPLLLYIASHKLGISAELYAHHRKGVEDNES